MARRCRSNHNKPCPDTLCLTSRDTERPWPVSESARSRDILQSLQQAYCEHSICKCTQAGQPLSQWYMAAARNRPEQFSSRPLDCAQRAECTEHRYPRQAARIDCTSHKQRGQWHWQCACGTVRRSGGVMRHDSCPTLERPSAPRWQRTSARPKLKNARAPRSGG
jgi:hypothetical protein